MKEKRKLSKKDPSVLMRQQRGIPYTGGNMRFFHLSDLHIGLKLINRDLREDQEYIFDQITDYVKRKHRRLW